MPKKFLLLTTIFSATFSSLIVITLHFLRTDYNPIERYVSEYAIGSYGTLAALSFSLFGISITSFYFWAKKNFKKGMSLILIWGLSIILLSFFTTDLKRSIITLPGFIHILLTGIGFGAFAIGSFFLSSQFKRYSSIFRNLSWIISIFLIFLSFGVLGDKLYAYNLTVPFPLGILSNIAGLIERVVLLSSVSWFFLAIYLLL